MRHDSVHIVSGYFLICKQPKFLVVSACYFLSFYIFILCASCNSSLELKAIFYLLAVRPGPYTIKRKVGFSSLNIDV